MSRPALPPPSLSEPSSASFSAAGSPPQPALTPHAPSKVGIVSSTSPGVEPAFTPADERKLGTTSLSRTQSSSTAYGGQQQPLDTLGELYDALPPTSSSPDHAQLASPAAQYSPVDFAAYEAHAGGAYDVNEGDEAWEGSALGMTLGGGVPVPFGTAGGRLGGGKRTGHCKFFNAQKGFGFILDNRADELGNDEVFVHYTAVATVQGGPGGFRSLLEGEAVEYDIVQGPKGWQAQNVTGPNGAPCIGTPPGTSSKSSLSSYMSDRRSSISGVRSEFGGRRPSVAGSSIPTTPRKRVGSSYYSSSSLSPSTGNPSSYSSPASRNVPLPPSGAHYLPSCPNAAAPFHPYIVFPYQTSPLQAPNGVLYPFPPGAYNGDPSAPPPPSIGGGEENGRPSQPQGQLPNGIPAGGAYYGTLPGSEAPSAAMPVPGSNGFFPGAHPAGFPLPLQSIDTSVPYIPSSSSGYPISSSTSSAPPSAYPISSSQTSPAGQFLHPYPPPPPAPVGPPPHHPNFAAYPHPGMAFPPPGGPGGVYPMSGNHLGGAYEAAQGYGAPLAEVQQQQQHGWAEGHEQQQAAEAA
ncbi:hypothetical protein JCM8097_006107 [Rhodosporidiobolus ruineniae]